jgi:gluconokinase
VARSVSRRPLLGGERSSAVPPLVLAIDVGTSSCRCAVYDAGGRRLRWTASQRCYFPELTEDGGAQLDAELLVQWVTSCVDEALRALGPLASELRLVATSAFWHSLLGLDAAGRPVTPVLIWMDARGRREQAEFRRRVDPSAVRARTGCEVHWSFAPVKLWWLAKAWPEVFRSVRRWLSFGEYLVERLTGRACPSLSMASASGLFNQHSGVWDAELLESLRVAHGQLPDLGAGEAPVAGLAPVWRERWPALSDAAWAPPVGDGAANSIGMGCTGREQLALMVGTSGAVRVSWRAGWVEPPSGLWSYRAGSERAVLGGSLNDGGLLLAWMLDRLGLPPLEALDAQLDAMSPDEHGLTLVPSWAGERSPGWSAHARGLIDGLSVRTTALDLVRAAMEAVAVRFGRLEALLTSHVPEVRFRIAGGGALLRSRAWVQIMADALGKPLIACREVEGSSRGAALLALEAAGLLPGGVESAQLPWGPTYEPRPLHTERYRLVLLRQERRYASRAEGPTAAESPELEDAR